MLTTRSIFQHVAPCLFRILFVACISLFVGVVKLVAFLAGGFMPHRLSYSLKHHDFVS